MWAYDVGRKPDRYERWGVRELWLVDTDSRTVLVRRRSRPRAPAFDVALEVGEGEQLRSPLLPGFELPVDAVFAVPGHQK
jgi:Uma2 family endonuclease